MVCALGCQLALPSAAALPPVTSVEEEVESNLYHEAGTGQVLSGSNVVQFNELKIHVSEYQRGYVPGEECDRCLELRQEWPSLVAQLVKNPSAMRETWV